MEQGTLLASERPEIVLVHGLGCDQQDWIPLLPFLRPWAEVTTLDLPGHGTARGVLAESIEDMATHVLSNWPARGLSSVLLVGHSLGCRVILDVARRCPEGLRGLVLLDGSLQTRGAVDSRTARLWAEAMSGHVALFDAVFAQMAGPETPTWFVELIRQRLSLADMSYLARASAALADWDEKCARDSLKRLSVPVAAIQTTVSARGERRSVSGHEVTAWMDAVRAAADGEVEAIPGCSHFVHVDHPQLIANAIMTLWIRILADRKTCPEENRNDSRSKARAGGAGHGGGSSEVGGCASA